MCEAGVSITRCLPMVPQRWRREPMPSSRSSRAVTSSFAEREDIAIWRAQRFGGSGDRPPARPVSVHDLARAAPQRVDADLAARLQGVHCAVARRAPGAAAEGREAGHATIALRDYVQDRLSGAVRLADGAGDRTSRSIVVKGRNKPSSRRPPLGAGVEPRADRPADQGGLPP